MTTFIWLLLGHLVGDWLLQNDWMAQGKKRAVISWAGLTHFTIYTTAILSSLFLAGMPAALWQWYLILGLLIFISHWLIDATPVVEQWIHFYRQSDIPLMRIMVDQTLHVLILALLVVICDWGVM